MSLSTDLGAFFSDFAVDAYLATGEIIKVILDEPDQETLSLIESSDVRLTGRTSDLKRLKKNDQLVIDDITYVIKNVRAVEDGQISNAYCARLK